MALVAGKRWTLPTERNCTYDMQHKQTEVKVLCDLDGHSVCLHGTQHTHASVGMEKALESHIKKTVKDQSNARD
jgi:hypothetical protein